MEIKSVLLNDEPTNTYYEVGKDGVYEITYLPTDAVRWDLKLFEVWFEDGRPPVKVPYHSVLLWR